MTVPFLDLRRSSEALDEELEAAFRRVLRSGRYILGPEVECFEAECARYVGAEHAVAVSSGTDALLAALMALGVGAGDEVVCPTYSFFATAGAIWRLGARPVFVDSDPQGFNLDPRELAARITKKTKAIVPVHLFGECADLTAILSIATDHGVPVVEDAAQALGARHAGRSAGVSGALGCFSFFPSKNLGALGDAGLVVTNDPALAEAVRALRVHGGKPRFHHAVVGGNFRMDELQAAFLRVKLRHLDRATHGRVANAGYYAERLTKNGAVLAASDGAGARVILPAIAPGNVFNQFVVVLPRAGDRDRVRALLAERGVATEIYYPVPLHLQECFAELGHAAGDFPVAERLAAQSLALPMFPELSRAELDHVVASLCEALE